MFKIWLYPQEVRKRMIHVCCLYEVRFREHGSWMLKIYIERERETNV